MLCIMLNGVGAYFSRFLRGDNVKMGDKIVYNFEIHTTLSINIELSIYGPFMSDPNVSKFQGTH